MPRKVSVKVLSGSAALPGWRIASSPTRRQRDHARRVRRSLPRIQRRCRAPSCGSLRAPSLESTRRVHSDDYVDTLCNSQRQCLHRNPIRHRVAVRRDDLESVATQRAQHVLRRACMQQMHQHALATLHADGLARAQQALVDGRHRPTRSSGRLARWLRRRGRCVDSSATQHKARSPPAPSYRRISRRMTFEDRRLRFGIVPNQGIQVRVWRSGSAPASLRRMADYVERIHYVPHRFLSMLRFEGASPLARNRIAVYCELCL